jgi:hypothetical protein
MSATARLALVTLRGCYPGLPLRDGDPRIEALMASAAAAPRHLPVGPARRPTSDAALRNPRRRDLVALNA